MQQVVHGRVHGGEPGLDLVQNVQAARVVRNPPPQQAHVERHRDEVVADFVGDVRRHPAQVGQAVFPGKLAILDLQFVGQPADFLAQRLVRVLQLHRRRMPRGENRLQIGAGIQRHGLGKEVSLGHGFAPNSRT